MYFISFLLYSLFCCFSGLNNNSDLETFNLLHTIDDDLLLPVRYIKLEPLESWGSNFNYSLWYVELQGIDTPHVVSNVVTKFYQVSFNTILLFNYDI